MGSLTLKQKKQVCKVNRNFQLKLGTSVQNQTSLKWDGKPIKSGLKMRFSDGSDSFL